ncbi:hypothetical protein HK097_008091 [Rhizophlyctis rosea]|uniref:ACT domain-containing protein n=1 Tax=Rhizophlyctis rosea TaxID=64517 RepID=A0AAD5SCA9_9FUNG|nr:hypothetical protein HK097_008091 [Rhizophlyctis rosea]
MLRQATWRQRGLTAKSCTLIERPTTQLIPTRLNSSTPKLRRRTTRHPFAHLVPQSPPSAEEAVNNILYNFPPASPSPVTRHVLNCLVSNEPGVLSRVSGILAGRGFNIDSLVVAKTEVPDLSRMTIVLNGQSAVIDQAKRQLEDQVPIWAVLDYTHAKIVERELLMVKVSTVPHHETGKPGHELSDSDSDSDEEHHDLSPLLGASVQRQAVSELARLFGARIVDVSTTSVIVELAAKSDRVDAFLKLLKPYGILEATRSGVMAMPRSPLNIGDSDAPEEEVEAVDASLLPPG